MIPARQRALVTLLIVIGLAAVVFFGMRAIHAFREFRRHGPPPFPPGAESFDNQPAETDVELIRDWMTVPYIARTYRIHPKVIFDALAIPPKGNDEKSLLQLNAEFFPANPGFVLELVKTVVRANEPVPTAIPAATSIPPIP